MSITESPNTAEVAARFLRSDAGRAAVHRSLATLHLPRALADDVVQDALRRVCVATAPGGEPIDNVEAFVTTVVHRAAIDIVRGCVRRPQVVDLRGVDPDAEVQGCWFTPASHLDAGADACAGEALASVRRTIHHLLGDDPMVRSPRWPWRYGLWARAFDADDDDTLAGIAPFVRDPSVAADAVARVLVPPAAGGHTRRRVEVDVTDRPEMPRPSPALSVVERARYQGARAARAERLGDRVQARYRWSRCARLWEAAGDQRRTAQAGARAVVAPGVTALGVTAPGVGPLVCDLVYGC